ncbi:phage terminase small subunit P27 family [Saccharopolyspora shandongensis]|uniref:phage terminase small subunit P27 family n=1 Tax=Saccharopolyspora shandongensis TaxID=418495 RepID=UPI00344769C8
MPRTAQPAALKLLHGRGNGTDSGGRKVATGPGFRRIAPEAPEWLSPEAAAEWGRVVPGLQRLDILKEEDRAVLAAYCETWARFVEATRDVQTNGLTITNRSTRKDGTESEWTTTNPAVGIAKAAGTELRAFAAHFGLTPSTEAALSKGGSGGDEEDDNPF